jgi:hypothetical protein
MLSFADHVPSIKWISAHEGARSTGMVAVQQTTATGSTKLEFPHAGLFGNAATGDGKMYCGIR